MSIGTLSPKKVFLLRCWQEILNDPELDRYHDDYRIETDAGGRIVMSPRFGAGAREVWICERNNKVSFFGSDGRLKHSLLCPDFPSVLDLSPPQPRV